MVRQRGKSRWTPVIQKGEGGSDSDDDGWYLGTKKERKKERKARKQQQQQGEKKAKKKDVDVAVVVVPFAGPGKKLSDAAAPLPVEETEARKVAGEAALARMEQRPSRLVTVHTSQDAFRKRLLDATAAGATAAERAHKEEDDDEAPVKELALLSLRSPCPCLLTFTCPLTGATLTKSERDARIREAISQRLERDPVEGSIMMIHTFNNGPNRDRVQAAVEVLCRYVDNVVKHHAEEKYRLIRVGNRVFQEKVNGVEGCREFLQALGFESVMVPVEEEGQEEEEDVEVEEFLVLPEQQTTADALRLMTEGAERLRRGEPIRARLDRRPQAFRPSSDSARFELPPDFSRLTPEELEREKRSEAAERTTNVTPVLATRAMKERQAQRELTRKYSYTVLRVKLPDGNLLQGNFYAWDRTPALFGFVRESLVAGSSSDGGLPPFQLLAPGGQKLQESEDVALVQCNLVPAALLTFSWDLTAVQPDAEAAAAASSSLLKPDLLNSIRTLSM